MEIEYDETKRETTLSKRGLDFAKAAEIFEDRHVSRIDDRFDYGEERLITVGFMGGRMVVAVWTERVGKRRIISLRKANDDEQAAFGPILG
ncbi:MAG: BrnT family toxin [Beijerinckiaceae bacterium]|nr:BrnT family toxin [Beijerinckiaceae bacterium]